MQWLLGFSLFMSMAISYFHIYVRATSFFYIYVMATSFFYIYIDIYIDICIDIDIYIAIYKLTERPVVLLNAICLPLLSKKSQCDKIFKPNYKKRWFSHIGQLVSVSSAKC